jgi:hypothetical protein
MDTSLALTSTEDADQLKGKEDGTEMDGLLNPSIGYTLNINCLWDTTFNVPSTPGVDRMAPPTENVRDVAWTTTETSSDPLEIPGRVEREKPMFQH